VHSSAHGTNVSALTETKEEEKKLGLFDVKLIHL